MQVPESIEVVIDIRIPPSVREQQFYAMMQDWCERVGPGVSYKVEYLRFTETHPDAVIEPTSSASATCALALSGSSDLICNFDPFDFTRISGVVIECSSNSTGAEPKRLAERVWNAFAESVGRELLAPEIFPGGTDGRYLREQGLPVIGFSPIRRTPILLHCHDEYLPVDVFLEGIRVYERLIPALANLSAQ